MPDDRLSRQLNFIRDIDGLKSVLRATRLQDGSRPENSAEHSWHVALMAPVLAEYAAEPVDVLRVMKMLLIHDVVEVDAGDAPCFDDDANQGKEERERQARDRIFGLLPQDQAAEFIELWNEFEAGETADAVFATSLDRLSGSMQNYANDGGTWIEFGVTRERILKRQGPIELGAPQLWPVVVGMADEILSKEPQA